MSQLEELINGLSIDLITDLIAGDSHDESVGNLELEFGDDYLLESGGFILLE